VEDSIVPSMEDSIVPFGRFHDSIVPSMFENNFF
jgi:hypothetical protein